MASREEKLKKVVNFAKEQAAEFASGEIEELEPIENDESGAMQFLDALTGSDLYWTHLARLAIPVSDAPFEKMLVEILTDAKSAVPLVTTAGVKFEGKVQKNLCIEDMGKHSCFLPVSEEMLSFRDPKHTIEEYENRNEWEELTTALNEDQSLCETLHDFKWDYYNYASQTLFKLTYGGQIAQSEEQVLVTCQSYTKKKGFFRIRWLFELQERLDVLKKVAGHVTEHSANVSEHSGNPIRNEEQILEDLRNLG